MVLSHSGTCTGSSFSGNFLKKMMSGRLSAAYIREDQVDPAHHNRKIIDGIHHGDILL
jgi:hypothetical protein